MKKVVLLLIVLIVGCTKEAPIPEDELKPDVIIKPNDPNKDDPDEVSLGHDNWNKVSITVTEGELINGVFNGYKNKTNLKFKTVQEVSFEADGLEVKFKGETILLVKGNYYGLEIKYFTKEGKLMNRQFATAEMSPIHQHFFISSENSPSLKQTKKYTIDYTYRDTNPINKSIADGKTQLRENDPIGLKGYFKVIKDASYSFDMMVMLVHILGKDKFVDNGKARPFYSPSINMIGVTDFRHKVPMKIFTDKTSSNYIKDISKEFNITEAKAKEELKQREISSLRL